MNAAKVTEILEDAKARLQKEMPDQHFFFLLMPVSTEQMLALGEDALNQVQKRMVQQLQKEINQALIDQRRET